MILKKLTRLWDFLFFFDVDDSSGTREDQLAQKELNVSIEAT